MNGGWGKEGKEEATEMANQTKRRETTERQPMSRASRAYIIRQLEDPV
jgi:hypothetical protein